VILSPALLFSFNWDKGLGADLELHLLLVHAPPHSLFLVRFLFLLFLLAFGFSLVCENFMAQKNSCQLDAQYSILGIFVEGLQTDTLNLLQTQVTDEAMNRFLLRQLLAL
jgi:hypothetical protein